MSNNIIYMDDLPFNLDEQETEALMKKIPGNIAAIGIEHGFSDSVFKDNIFEYIVKDVLKFKTIDEYYESEMFKTYAEKGELLSNSMLLGDVDRYKITFNIIVYDKDLNEIPETTGSFESVAIDFDTAKKNAFFELAKLIFKQGYVTKKLEIVKIKRL